MTESVFIMYLPMYLIIPFAFIMGSIPFGLLFTRYRGIDLRASGSKNIGATNVLRTAGKAPAILTLLGDVTKGALPVLICNLLISAKIPEGNTLLLQNAKDLWGGIAGISAVAGHIFSIFLYFRGGKGVATGFGVLLAYSPLSALVTFLIWISVAAITRYSSLSAIVAVSMLPVVFALLDYSKVKILFGILLSVLIVYRHKANIRNIIDGKESKIGNKVRESDSKAVKKG